MEQYDDGLLRRLRKPAGPVDVVLDTDTFNEIDDQFALAFVVKYSEKFRVKGLHAAPFYNGNSSNPGDGMEKSYDEILKLLSLMKTDSLAAVTRKGAGGYLPSETEPVDSPAALALAELAMGYRPDRPLYVIAIGAITNVASALLIRPEITDRLVVVWLGGHAREWPHTREFNMMQDVAAARVVFNSGVAVVQLPCMGVVSAFTSSGPELEHWLKGKNALCDYLVDYTAKSALTDGGLPNWTRAIWDLTAAGWLLEGDYMLDRLDHIPIPQYDHHYSFDPTRHFYRYVYHIHRDKLFNILFEVLAR
jgi:inosine-uridine nucleoside N-ribohydrolase